MNAFVAASVLSPEHLISTFGLLGILVVVFAECGLLLGFFLPGDSLLFFAGLLVAGDVLGGPIWWVALLIAIAAFLGNVTGYWIGYQLGPAVFRRPDSRFFRQEYVERTHHFFDRFGGRAIVLARFVPIVRTFITAMAGVGRMPFGPYAAYSAVGALLWGMGVTLLGYYLGQVAFVRDHIELILIGLVLVSVVPIYVELRRGRRREPA